jgi:UDP-3-O-[3-hydroxymyristoyl] glucosamine N-acyltransferase
MGYRLNRSVPLAEIAEGVGAQFIGDLTIEEVSSFRDAGPTTLSFSNAPPSSPVGAIIASELPNGAAGIISQTPRLTFVNALQWLERNSGFQHPIADPQLDQNVVLGQNVHLGKGVRIGTGTRIGHNVVIADGVAIGAHCIIKSGAVIGEDGFGMERNADGDPIRFIHFGTVIVGDNVEIGSLSTVCRGTLGDTIIEDHAKIDDRVHVAHNCIVRRGAIITASVTLSGGVEVGELAWIGPNASILQKLNVGTGAFVGLAAVVTHDVPESTKVAGNPARALPKRSE